MNPKIIETDVPLQLVINETETSGQVVLKIPPRTRIIVGDTIQIKRKPSNFSNRKRQGEHVSLPLTGGQRTGTACFPESREPTKDEVDQMDKTLGELLQRAGFEMPRTEEQNNESISWNNIQLKPDVYTGQLTPMPKQNIQWSQFSQEDSNWYFPLPPLDLQDNLHRGSQSDQDDIPYEDLTPSSKQIIDEIREMNLWNDALASDALEGDSSIGHSDIDEAYQMTECQEIKVIDDIKMGNDDSEAESDEDIQIDQLDLCEELFPLGANASKEQLNHIPVNCNAERSDSLDTAEVLSEFDI
jgi:hypothetical protein